MPHVSAGCCTRRDWLRLGAFGLSLPGLLRAADAPGRTPAARSCVLFLLHGGPSQLDTWDMKPSAPPEVRGEFRPIRTSVPGLHFCEHLPRLAARRPPGHGGAFDDAHGHQSQHRDLHRHDRPGAAARPDRLHAVGKRLPPPRRPGHAPRPVRRNLPSAVSLPDPVTDGPYTTPGQNGGFLGAGSAPFRVLGDPNDDDFRVDGLAGEPERLGGRRELLKALDRRPGPLASDPAVERLDQYQRRPWPWSVRTRRGGRSTSAASRTGCASATAGTATARRCCWRGGWSRPACAW